MNVRKLDSASEQAISRFLKRIAERYDISRVIAYGSRARGTHRADSDLDLAVLLRGTPSALVAAKLDMADAAFDVLLETGILISPLPVWENEWKHPESFANPALLRNIERDGIRL